MPRIKILSEVLSNKIAAGEVVERPASVVKELVENAIDAESSRITVEVKKGGKSFIRVSDNGVGMDRDDSLLALERFATSKIYDEEGLFSIATLGFRGEALPSIASVSDMEIVTKTAAADVGTKIVVKGGQVKDVSDVGGANGTMITVSRLFYNTPARRKFLKTDQTEMGHISDTVTRTVLAMPSIHFRFSHNGRDLGNWSSTKNSLHRITEVLKGDVGDYMRPVDYSQGHIRIHGFAASAEITRTTSRGQYIYVNGRFVRDPVIQHAVMEGYASRFVKGQFPVAVLFLTLPFHEVDVNVHPTKSTVRFQAPRHVHEVIATGIAKTMESFSRFFLARRPAVSSNRRPPAYHVTAERDAIREPSAAFRQMPAQASSESAPALWEKERTAFASMRVIGQLLNSYIVCESEDGLVLVDQHAAHERVVFDSMKAAYERSKIVTQGVLIPEKLELTHREAGILDTLIENLQKIGLDIEHFGGTTYLVRAIPSILGEKSVAPLIMDIIDKAAEIGFSTDFHGAAADECLMLMACHGAIRANKRLSRDEMKMLLKQMDRLEDPTHCPHGRPTVIRRSVKHIEKDFKRIV
jgi:DNA mismatch repair protein MutL